MSRWLPAVIVALLIAGFAFVAQAIIGVKLLELRVKISRERILNYELSSRVLKEKFISLVRSESQGFQKEIKQNLLESAIMNDRDPEALALSWTERIGYWVINAIRPLALKPFLHLLADQEELILMKYAFFMERNRRYDEAIKKYKKLLSIMPKDRSDARGFALLHTGYSMAVSGKTDEAIQVLETVRREFAGSHFSQTAATLLSLLREQNETRSQIEKEGLSEIEKARRYFERSLYALAIPLFERQKSLLPMDRYRLSRSFEETGRIKKAIEGYLAIVKEDRDPAAVRAANRRLLLIGNFYGGGKKVKKFAEKKAQDLGDTTAVEEIRVAVKTKRKDVILDEIREGTQASGEKKPDPMLAELGKELEQNIELEEKIVQEPPRLLAKPVYPGIALNPGGFALPRWELAVPDAIDEQSFPKPLPEVASTALLFPEARMEILLSDGRVMVGRECLFSGGGQAEVRKSGFSSQLPVLLIKEIRIEGLPRDAAEPGNAKFMILMLMDGQKISVQRVVLQEGGNAGIVLLNGQEKIIPIAKLKRIAFP